MIIRTNAFARAGLVGNPSDGYFGKTISVIVRNFSANVALRESTELEVCCDEAYKYGSIDDLVGELRLNGYYGATRLMKAAIKRFYEYCRDNGIELERKNFSLNYSTTIPRRVGLAGSSAIVTATLRALMQFYDVSIPRAIQPSLILSAERDELGICAGYQDRVIQTYEGMVYMDFDREKMEARGYGDYEPLDASLLPPLFLAYDQAMNEGSEVHHQPVKSRFDRGDRDVAEVMTSIANLAELARDALLSGRKDELGPLMSANFELRKSLFSLSARNIEMIEIAREAGAYAKFAGSGGAAIGTYPDEEVFQRLAQAYRQAGFTIIKPVIDVNVSVV